MSSQQSEATSRRENQDHEVDAQSGLQNLLALYQASARVAGTDDGGSTQFTAKILERAIRDRFATPD